MDNVATINISKDEDKVKELTDRLTYRSRIEGNTYFRDCAADLLVTMPWLLKEIKEMGWADRDPEAEGYAFDKPAARLIVDIHEQLEHSREYIDSLNPDREVEVRISGHLEIDEVFYMSAKDYENMTESKACEYLEPFISHHALTDVDYQAEEV
tara:strand:+ start:155 stop:616 length:462 start_codon:yes stop_codon:yes gene_type:complete